MRGKTGFLWRQQCGDHIKTATKPGPFRCERLFAREGTLSGRGRPPGARNRRDRAMFSAGILSDTAVVVLAGVLSDAAPQATPSSLLIALTALSALLAACVPGGLCLVSWRAFGHAAGTQDSHTLTQAAWKIALFHGVFSLALQYEGRSRPGVEPRRAAPITRCHQRVYSECPRRLVAHPATGRHGMV